MLKTILSISGRPGLYKFVSQGKNMLLVESLVDGKKLPVYARDKVISLGDVSIYTETEDIPLAEVLEMAYKKAEGKPVDLKKYEGQALRDYFGEILTNFDRERVNTSDIRKLFQWYNLLVNAGFTEFVEKEETEENPEEPKNEKPQAKEEKAEKGKAK